MADVSRTVISSPVVVKDSKSSPVDARGSCALVVVLGMTVAIAATTGVGVGASWFDEQRIILLVALAVTALVGRLINPAPLERATTVLLAALALGLASSAFALRPQVAAVEWSVYCLMAVLILSARSGCPSTVDTTAALVAAIVPGAYVTGVMANYVSALLLNFPIGADTLLVGFSNPRFPAQLQVLTIPLLPLAMQRAPSSFWRAGLAVVAALWWMCFIGSGSRTGWIAIGVAAFAVCFFGSEGRRWLKWQVVFALSGALLWALLFHALPTLLSHPAMPETGRFANFASMDARWALWRLSIDAALSHPLLGLGPMHFSYIDNGLSAHPHNFWLQLAAEWGLPATLLIGFAALALIVGLWRSVKRETELSSRRLGVAVLAAVVAWGVGTLSDGYMVIPTSQAMSTAVLMLAVMWLRLSEPDAPRVTGRFVSIVATAFCGIAIAVIAVLPLTEFGQPARREQTWRAEHPGQFLWPRFWQQGWIGPDQDPSARQVGRSPAPLR